MTTLVLPPTFLEFYDELETTYNKFNNPLLKKDTIRKIYDELKEKRADIQNLTSYTDPIPTENFTAKVQKEQLITMYISQYFQIMTTPSSG